MNSHLIPIFSFSLATVILGFLIFPYYIKLLIKHKLWKQIREEALVWKATEFSKLHKVKTWTPTLWWLWILFVVFLMVFVSIVLQQLWFVKNSLFNQKETYLTLFTLFSVWCLWAVDDFMNIRWIWKTKWISARFKMLWLLIFSWTGAWWFYDKLEWWEKLLNVPIFWWLELWIYFIPLFIFIIIASANSVNVTDWLDWLAWGLLLFAYWVYAYITYDQWLYLLSTLCVTIIWALVAFLWFNIKPAKFFMWDVWSLALWANLWIMAMLTNTMFVFIIVWAIFIFETLSVIIQLTSKKLRNWKKIFKISPFHHHLEAIWWSEETVVFRMRLFWIILSAIWIIVYKL